MPILVGALMLLVPLAPAAAPSDEAGDGPTTREQGFRSFETDPSDPDTWIETPEEMEAFVAAFEAMMAAPSELDAAGAQEIFGRILRGEEVDVFGLLEFSLYMRDHQTTPQAVEVPITDALLAYVQEAVDEVALGSLRADIETGWGDDVWSELVAPETLAYLTLGAAHPPLFLSINSVDVFAALGIISCSRGIVCIRTVVDLAAGIALDFHKTTDQVLAHTGLVIDVGIEQTGEICFPFFGCIPLFGPFADTPDVAIAEDADYVHTCPANNCQLADRASNSDILQVAYDALSSVGRLRVQEWTAAPVGTGTPVPGEVPGGTPGVADLHAVAPAPTYYGVQSNPDVTGPLTIVFDNYPGIDPAADDVVGGVHVRSRADHGLHPGDSTGITAVFDKTSFRNLDLDIWTMRWNNVGLGDAAVAGIGGSPGEMVYDAPGGSLLGGAGPLWTWSMSLNDPAVEDPGL